MYTIGALNRLSRVARMFLRTLERGRRCARHTTLYQHAHDPDITCRSAQCAPYLRHVVTVFDSLLR